MNEQEKKKVKVKLKLVAFSDLPKMKEYSFKEIGVGQIKVGQRIKKTPNHTYSKEALEREGEEPIFVNRN